MSIGSILSDPSSLETIAKVVSYTLFYGCLTYLPLRVGCEAFGRVKVARARRRKQQRSTRPRPVSTTWVIR